jgi:hypothetical protein
MGVVPLRQPLGFRYAPGVFMANPEIGVMLHKLDAVTAK